jgi:beta-phosphoglucomutase-like phosphatase (HAD superfamily)
MSWCLPRPALRSRRRPGRLHSGRGARASEDCVVVEDAPAGIRSGKAAGARVLALRTTNQDAELLSAGADWIVDDLSALTFRPRPQLHPLLTIP